MSPHAIIAGAGVGGVATALALSEAGYRTTVYERAAALEEFGAGLQFPPNATRVLRRLGVLDAVRSVATLPRAIRTLRGSDDALLSQMPLDEGRWGAPYLALHRADLLAALVAAARRSPSIQIRCGSPVTGVATSDSGVQVTLDAEPFSDCGDLLVGADGLRSRVRDTFGFVAADQPTFSGRVAFRALAPADRIDARWLGPDVVLRLGANAHLVHYPLRGGSVVNLVAVIEDSWRGDSDHPWDGEADLDILHEAFGSWSRSTRRLIGAADAWRAWPLYGRPALGAFTRGRVALVGDAAHPMVPFLAQGAAQAVEDADALAESLAQTSSISDALAAYSRRRVARATRVQAEAARQGRVYHLSGALAVARDAAMRMLGPRRLSATYDWLYRV